MSARWLTAREIAALALPGLPATERNVQLTAKRMEWRSRRRSGRGGGFEYDATALPAAAQRELVRRGIIEQPTVPATVVAVTAPEAPEAKPWGALAAHEKDRATARAEVLTALAAFQAEHGLSREAARAAFAEAWNGGRIGVAPDVQPLVHGYVNTLSARTLARWESQAKRAGMSGLAGRHSDRREGKSRIDRDRELRDLAVAMLVQFPHAGAPHVAQAIRARLGAERMPPLRTLQHWISSWRRDNASAYLAMSNPDAWRSKYRAAAGRADAGIERLNQLWELDSTPADVLLADGRRYQLIGAIDVYSRRLRLQVVPTSSAAGIAALLRRCILAWGVPETVRTDNGKDYTSNHITRVLVSLQIRQDLTPPFSPERKPFIERALQTWSHGLLELMPGFIGHSVGDRKAIESRRAFAARFGSRGETVELRCTADELQAFCDRWAEHVYATTPHAGLGGETPQAVALAWPYPVRRVPDERALDVLLSTAPGDGLRVVGKKGLRIDGALYIHPELGAHVGRQVRVLYDESDLGRVYVFDVGAGAYLCTAECPARTGIARAEVAARMRERQRQRLGELKAELRRTAREQSVDAIAEEILAEREATNNVTAFPRRADTHETPELAEAARAADADEAPTPERRAEEIEAARALAARIAQRKQAEAERQAWSQSQALAETEAAVAALAEIERRIAAGQPVSDDDRAWFQQSQSWWAWQAHKRREREGSMETRPAAGVA